MAHLERECPGRQYGLPDNSRGGFGRSGECLHGAAPGVERLCEPFGERPDDPRTLVDERRIDLDRGGAGLETGQDVLGLRDTSARVDRELASRGRPDGGDDRRGPLPQRATGQAAARRPTTAAHPPGACSST